VGSLKKPEMKAQNLPGALSKPQEFGLARGMVDVKVCAIYETWSGLNFIFRLKDGK